MANMIARLGVVLGLDSAEFVKGVESAQRKLDQFAQAAQTYGRIAGAALIAASAAALKYADEIADVAKANDLAIDSVVKLSNALALAGGKSDDVGKLLAGFTNFVDKAAGGSLDAQRSFEKIGISLKEVGALSSQELLDKTLKALVQIEDPITRNAKAMEIFGKAAKGVDMRELLVQIEEAKTLSEKQAEGIQKAADAFDEMTKSAQKTKMTLASELGPPLKATLDYFKEMKSEGDGLASAFKIGFQTIAVLAANVAFVVKTLVADVSALGKAAKSLVTGDIEEVGKIYRDALARAEKDRMALDQFERRVMGTGDGRKGMDDPRIVGRVEAVVGRETKKAIDPEEEKRRRERERLEKFIRQHELEAWERQQKMNEELGEYLTKLEKANIAMRQGQELEAEKLQLSRQIMDIELNRGRLLPEEVQYRRTIAELTFEHKQNMQKLHDAEISREEREMAYQRETENFNTRMELARKRMIDQFAGREGTIAQGFFQKMGDFFRDLPTQFELGAQAFDSVLGNMEAALNRFVQTGKLSFKDLARSIIQDLIRIQLQAQMTSLFRMFVSSFSPQVGPTMDAGPLDASFNQYLRRADGGAVTGNTPYMVGERGPELFVPRGSGAIIPNNKLSGVGGVTHITNNYIDAIDVQSFEQRILGSSNTVWAANQYAQKSLATGRGRT